MSSADCRSQVSSVEITVSTVSCLTCFRFLPGLYVVKLVWKYCWVWTNIFFIEEREFIDGLDKFLC